MTKPWSRFARAGSSHASVFLIAMVVLGASGCNRKRSNAPPTTAVAPAASTAAPAAVDLEASDQPAPATSAEPTPADPDTSAMSSNMRAAPQSATFDRSGTWTTRRMIALVAGGPRVIDLSISVGGQDLNQAASSVTEQLAMQIFADLETPVRWQDLLEHPLIRSGWLGNLIPEDEQKNQLISMYDTERDDIAALDEFASFLSRGLSRNSPLQISDVGNSPDADMTQSPWGKADENNNFALDESEAERFGSLTDLYDYNGDAVITTAELAQTRAMRMQTATMRSTSLLESSTLLVVDDTRDMDADAVAKVARGVASTLIRHCTFLPGIARDQWSNFSPTRWQELDRDQSDSLDKYELESLTKLTPDIHIWVRFPGLEQTTGNALVHAEVFDDAAPAIDRKLSHTPSDNEKQMGWHANSQGGRLDVEGLLGSVQVNDAFSESGQARLRESLSAALGNAQLRTFFTMQLQLKENAFELLDEDENGKLSDEEFQQVWRWLGARQSTRVLARWMLDSDPWFHFLDTNGDGRLTEIERGALQARIAGLDADRDRAIAPRELPMIIRFELNRTDARLGAGPLAQSPPSTEDDIAADWFSAMDSNRDGAISRSEFLGSEDDFVGLDQNKDGIVSRGEVYE